MSSLSGLIWRPSAILPDPIASLARGGWEEIAGRASRARRSPRNERGERLEREERRTADGAPTFDLCRGRRTDAACAVRRGVARALGLALCSTRGSSYEKREEKKKPTRARLRIRCSLAALPRRSAVPKRDISVIPGTPWCAVREPSKRLHVGEIFIFARNVSHIFASRESHRNSRKKEPPHAETSDRPDFGVRHPRP